MVVLLDSAFDNWFTILLSLAVCVTLYFYFQRAQKFKGPWGLPYLGYYPFLSDKCHLELDKMTKKYGEAFCFTCMGQTYVHLGSVKAIREAHVTKSHCFSQRPSNFSLGTDIFGNGVVFLKGEEWKAMRKFFVQVLREYGMGKKIMDDLLGEHLHRTVDTLRDMQGQNFDALTSCTIASTEVIKALLFSGVKLDDSDVTDLIETYTNVLNTMQGKRQLLSGPLLKYVILNLLPEYRRYRQNKFKMDSIFAKIVRQHEKDFNKANIRDIIDCYINERKSLEEQRDPKAKAFSEKALVATLVQFFGDGALSVGYVIASILKVLSQHPEVQKEIQREIDEVVGPNRSPSWGDRNSMPYTNAAIWETIRTWSLLPAFSTLECTRETTICGCHIPKGAVTFVNFWASFRDPAVYEEPDKFDPTRFLPSDEKKTKAEWPPFFGAGKRSCIGEPLVNMETFLFVTTILQQFDIIPAVEDEEFPRKKEQMIDSNILIRVTLRA